MGHVRFLVFYLLGGLIAALSADAGPTPARPLPVVGASGAIAGVMGAYLVLFPRRGCWCSIFLFFFVDVVEMPAVFFLGFWFLMQIVGGVGRSATRRRQASAFWAHAGGFLSGHCRRLAVQAPRAPARGLVEPGKLKR